jgi:hypothetical protein|tara:strand:- start:918 stop:1061 length:144 start_codon:yes stop_codon:yes gene_type:complete
VKNTSRDSQFKKQGKREQRYDLKQRKDKLQYKEALSQTRQFYGRQKR